MSGPNDPQDYVKVAAFTSLVEAEAAATALDAAEIEVQLRNTAAVGALPHMSLAFGGVLVCVPAAEAERAREILTAVAVPAPDEPEPVYAAPEPEPVLENARTLLARRAWRAAVLGIVFLPVLLHLLSLWHLIQLAGTPGAMSRRAWRMVIGALAVNVFVFTGVGLLVDGMLHPPPPPRFLWE